MANKSVEQQITDNDSSLTTINNALNSYNNPNYPDIPFNQYTTQHQNTITDSWKVDNTLADTYKQLNITKESLRKAQYSREEKKALEQAVASNAVLADIMSQKRRMPEIDTKTRIVEINNKNFRDKQVLINRLMYIIYFIIFSIALGASMAAGFITIRIVSIAFLIGLIILIIALISSDNFLKTYGDTSMSIAKGITKDVVEIVAPIKTCPDRCITKNTFEKYKSNFLDSSNSTYDPICTSKGSNVNSQYPYDNYIEDNKNFDDCDIGKLENCKDNRPKSYMCKWNLGTPTDGDPEYLSSSIPCHNYPNRVEVQNSS
jgi:hypothetical protein